MNNPAEKKGELFSQSALEKLQSPEQLDQLMRVTNPSGWLALIGIAIVLSVAGVWSIFGTIPTKVQGQGILVKSGGIFLAVAQGNGQVKRIFPHVGDQVDEGTLIARIDLPGLKQQVDNARARLAEIENEQGVEQKHSSTDLRLQLELLEGQRQTLESEKKSFDDRVKFLKKKVRNQKSLLNEGLITGQQLFATEQELKTAQGMLEKNADALDTIRVKATTIKNQAQGTGLERDMRLQETKRRLGELEEEFRLKSEVRSRYSGRVVEISTDVGSIIRVGQPVVSIEVRGSRLEAVVYVSPTDGKKVRAGMKIFLSPSTVKKEEYGLMVGKVRRVSEYPSTATGMMALLENEQLVQMFSQAGPPIAVYADLEVDHYSHSGYLWTSGLGPPVTISGGTVVSTYVTVKERSPLQLLVPFIKSKLGM
jgi:HlyD family secretion protein